MGRPSMNAIGAEPADVDLAVGPGESDNAQFGGLLERLRWKAGLSRSDAATKLGLSSEYLRLIEVGKRTPALGQMRNFLSVYGADGDIELISPQGYRQDLLVFDPLNAEGDAPVSVEFKSRIREARRTALGGPPDDGEDTTLTTQERPTESRAAEIGLVVSLLTRADDDTVRQVRKLLEDRVG